MAQVHNTHTAHTLSHFLQPFISCCYKCPMQDEGRTVACWENGKRAIIRLTGHHSPLIRSGSWVCVSQRGKACVCVCMCVCGKLSAVLMAVMFQECSVLGISRTRPWGPFRVRVHCRLSVSQLAVEKSKYLGPGKETCFSPPQLQNNNSLPPLCLLLRIAVIITLPCIHLRTSLSRAATQQQKKTCW